MHRLAAFAISFVALSIGAAACSNPPQSDLSAAPPPASDQGYLPLTRFYDLIAEEPLARASLDRIAGDWEDAYATMLLDLIYFSTSPEIDAAMTRLLEEKSGIRFRGDYDPFYRWIWSANPGQHPRYAEFMATLYSEIDPAFQDYFDDQPPTLIRLDEVLAIRYDGEPLSIAVELLRRNPVYQDRAGATEFVVFTDRSGANRVYDASGVSFVSWDGRGRAVSGDAREWTLTESALTAVDGTRKDRLAAHRAFWFGWYAQFPQTRLIK